jgi:hypothetical protein
MKGIIVVCLMMLSVVVLAEPIFTGFAYERWDSSTDIVSPHVRLILDQNLTSNLEAKLTLTPKGPMPVFSYGEIIVRKPVKGIESIDIGRQFPVFGYEWSIYRADQVPAMAFSAVNAPLAAADTGISASGQHLRLSWYAGIFIGDRDYGNISRYRGGPDEYLRLTYNLSSVVTLGASERLGITPASGVDIRAEKSRIALTLESITSAGTNQSYVQGEYKLDKRLSLASRYEWLSSGNRTGIAGTYAIDRNFTLKVLRVTNPSQTLIQAVVAR